MVTKKTTLRSQTSGPRQPITGRMSGSKSGGSMPKGNPRKAMGVPGTSIFGGVVTQIERSSEWIGQQRYVTASNIVTNISIVAAGVHHFLNLICHPNWSVTPADDTAKAQEIAEFIEGCMYDMKTPWSRVIRRAGMYRFHGFSVQEWTAKKAKDGKNSYFDVAPRPQFTIERWEIDEAGELFGVHQRSPQTGALLPISRNKMIYLVDDTLSDSPEGLGIFRHLAEPYNRLQAYLALEARGFERDLRGTPIGRAPLTMINKMVRDGDLTQPEADKMVAGLESFTKLQVKESTTGMLLDSQPYESLASDGPKVASAMQWGIELLKGDAAGLSELGKAVDRIQREMARIIGVEHLMMGDQGGNRALSQDKSRNLYLIANSVLKSIGDVYDNDFIDPLMSLNGFPEELKPYFQIEDVAFKDADEVANALQKMAGAGAILAPDDEVINDVRDLLGVSRQPERSDVEMDNLLRGNPPVEDDFTQEGAAPALDEFGEPMPEDVPGDEEGAAKSRLHFAKKGKGYKPKKPKGKHTGSGKGKYEETKHPRGAGGKFKDKPGAGDDKPKGRAGIGAPKAEFSGFDQSSKVVRNIGVVRGSINPSGQQFTVYQDVGYSKWERLESRLQSSSVKGGLSREHKDAIDHYTGEGNETLNEQLRMGHKIKAPEKLVKPKRSDFKSRDDYHDALDDYEDDLSDLRYEGSDATTLAGMDSMFKRVSLSEGVVTYRQAGEAFWSKVKKAGLKPGKVFTDKGFVSTSLDHDFAASWEGGQGVLMAIRVPKGSKALAVAGLSGNPGEREVIIARGAKFKVLRMKGKRMVVQLLKTGAKSSRTIKLDGAVDE